MSLKFRWTFNDFFILKSLTQIVYISKVKFRPKFRKIKINSHEIYHRRTCFIKKQNSFRSNNQSWPVQKSGPLLIGPQFGPRWENLGRSRFFSPESIFIIWVHYVFLPLQKRAWQDKTLLNNFFAIKLFYQKSDFPIHGC